MRSRFDVFYGMSEQGLFGLRAELVEPLHVCPELFHVGNQKYFFMRKLLILIAFGALIAGCSKQGDTQEYDSTASSTTKTSSSSQYSAPAPAPAPSAPAARGETPPPSDTPKPVDTSSHY
jgi:hypothetical protein